MASTRSSVEDTNRLLSVQARVRSLIHAHSGLREAMKTAWPQFLELMRIHLRDKWSASQGQTSGGDEPKVDSPRDLAPDPRELGRATLRRFSDPDRRTIVLTRLAWLADVGEPLPIIEEVTRTGDPEDFVIQYVSELAVTPVEGVGDSAMELGAPRPYHFAPSVAEAFLRHLEGWVARGDFEPQCGAAEKSTSTGSHVAAQSGAAQEAGSGEEQPGGGKGKELLSSPSQGRAIALTPDHESILLVLGRTPTRCLPVIDLASAGAIRNRETVGRLLGELARFGLVERPYGRRKGYALTDAGRKRLPGATPT